MALETPDAYSFVLGNSFNGFHPDGWMIMDRA